MNNPKKGALAFVRGNDEQRTVSPYLFHDGEWSPVKGHKIFTTIQIDTNLWTPKGAADWMAAFSTLVKIGYTTQGVFDNVRDLPLTVLPTDRKAA